MPTPGDTGSESRRSRLHHYIVQSIEARLNERMSFGEKIADRLVSSFGTMTFLIVNLFLFAIWILMNADVIPGIEPFDPFPFNFLTMVVSLEAIALSIFVLISQNQASKVSKLREEIDIQVNMITEHEVTKIISLLSYLMKHLKVPYESDPELSRMMKPLDTAEIEAELERQLKISVSKNR
jgi:uncharacterized membrane protein